MARPTSQSPPQKDEVLRVKYTLCISGPRPRAVAAVGYLEPSSASRNTSLLALSTEEVASLLSVNAADYIVLPEPIDPIEALMVPTVIETLGVIDNAAPDPGWDCIVVGSDSHTELVLSVARWCGVRRMGLVIPEGEVDLEVGASRVFYGARSDWQDDLVDYLLSDPTPVVCLDTTGENRVVKALLSVLPAHGRLALLGHGTSEPAPVNFYRDVHSKNSMIVGNQPLVDSRLMHRALNLLHHRIRPNSEDFPIVEEGEASTLEVPNGRWVILDWGQ